MFLFLQYHLVGVTVALIDVAVDAAPVHRRTVGGDAVVGGHVDGLVDGAEAVILPCAAVYGGGIDMQLSFHCDTLLSNRHVVVLSAPAFVEFIVSQNIRFVKQMISITFIKIYN